MRSTILLLLAFLLSACVSAGVPAATATPRLMSREQAIEIAVKSASMSRPEVSPALTAPTNIQAERMSLAEAMRLANDRNIRCTQCASVPVWYITMDGLWRDEMPAPGVTVTPGYYHHATVILDAVTGNEFSSSLRP